MKACVYWVGGVFGRLDLAFVFGLRFGVFGFGISWHLQILPRGVVKYLRILDVGSSEEGRKMLAWDLGWVFVCGARYFIFVGVVVR